MLQVEILVTHRAVVFESHEFLAPGESDDACGSAAVFGDDDFGFAGSIFGVIGIRSVQEHNHVGVLFDGPAFAQVGQSWSFVFSQFNASIELGECHHGDSQFLGEEFQSAGDPGDLLFAGRIFVFWFNELEVVDDDDAEL